MAWYILTVYLAIELLLFVSKQTFCSMQGVLTLLNAFSGSLCMQAGLQSLLFQLLCFSILQPLLSYQPVTENFSLQHVYYEH